MGEIWQAQAMNEHLALKKGDKVQVNSREGLLLKVNNASHNHFHHEGEAST
jgi:membrane-bound ClpP family serine protease